MPRSRPVPPRSAARRRPGLRAAARRLAALALVFAGSAGAAAAQPVPGFVEEFASTTGTWGGGAVFSNPGTGGAGGAGDGYLRVETFSPGNLGTVSFGPEYAGDWRASGVTALRLRLREEGGGGLEIHVGLGHSLNFWDYTEGFVPVAGVWTAFTADLADSTRWTRIIGTGPFAEALQNADRLRVRHDLAPLVQTPDPQEGAFGLDRVELLAGPVSVAPRAAADVAVLLSAPRPNPARDGVTLSFRVARAGAVRFEVLDAAGRRVRSAVVAAGAAGEHAWRWDGRDEGGARVPAGVYRVRASTAGASATRAVVRLD